MTVPGTVELSACGPFQCQLCLFVPRMASEDLPIPHNLCNSLQKCFRTLQEQHETWKSALTSCTSLLSSLSNLAEQMQASQKVAFANTPLRDFPSLPERLRYRQQCAVEALLEELWGKL